MKKFLYWLPRILSILLIIFISLFALDVFEEPQWFLPLLIHLIPSFILIILTIIAWKHEKFGGFAFIVAGLLMLVFTNFKSLIISIPIVIIGALFLSRKYLFKT
ncbi:MAG: hypothetical protein WC526_04615 [Patescibacteria group bacterium]